MERDTRFFQNVMQIDTVFNGEPAKIPVFYYDATVLTGIYCARMSVLKRLMPKKTYFPCSVVPGIGVVAITCFEYRDTDIRPYNEISISIPITYRHRRFIPGLAMLSALRNSEFHAYVHRLPVTTKIALDGGVVVYNFPKFLSTIEFQDKDGQISVRLAEGKDLILKLTATKIPTPAAKMIRYVTYPVKDDRAQHTDVLLNAKKFGMSMNPKYVELELGQDHAIARELREAIVWRRPILYQYMPEAQAILYPPNRLE